MTAGLQVWDGAGVERFSPSKRIARWLGSFYTGTSSGSFQVAEAVSGNFFYTATYQEWGLYSYPNIAVIGNNLVWTFTDQYIDVNGAKAARKQALIHYGVY